MKKALKKTIMLGSNLKNKCNKKRLTEHWDDYKKQKLLWNPTSKY